MSKIDFDTLYIAGAVTLIGAYYMLNNLTIKIDRYIITDTRTIGRMYLNGQYFCDTLEDTYRGQDLKDSKVIGATAIPNGSYQTIVNYSPKFNKPMPLLLNVPYFTGVRIHTGSSERDTDGCILLGDYIDNKWYANSDYVNKLKGLITQYDFCKTVIKIV